jgi:hypothetical protein
MYLNKYSVLGDVGKKQQIAVNASSISSSRVGWINETRISHQSANRASPSRFFLPGSLHSCRPLSGQIPSPINNCLP